ncbi:MAG: IS21-like element helper ATPase IstB [Candidatus Bathyarchaeota archaeon]|nr:IS21-like element helper ATPase IstB [Candidatus Bathyarchaeota archaeon]
MFNQMSIDKLNMMKLYGMAMAFTEQIESGGYNELSFEERFGMIIDKEMTGRENKKLKNLLKKAKLRYPSACIEDIDFRVDRGLSREAIMTLSRGDWIQKKQNVIITGPTGAGKTYIACALGNSACRTGISTQYFRLSKLLEALTIARADGSYGKMLIRLSRIKLLIVDDWGFAILTDKERRIFLDILEDRYDISSTIISSQLPVENWHDNIADPTIADAICDRLIHNAHRIRLTGGDSMRKSYSSLKET